MFYKGTGSDYGMQIILHSTQNYEMTTFAFCCFFRNDLNHVAQCLRRQYLSFIRIHNILKQLLIQTRNWQKTFSDNFRFCKLLHVSTHGLYACAKPWMIIAYYFILLIYNLEMCVRCIKFDFKSRQRTF